MSTNNCPNCGPYPCYNICPNSPNYYSPEQERYDDSRYVSDAEYYREAGYDDPDLYADRDDEAYEIEISEGMDVPDPLVDMFVVVGAVVYDAATDTLDDIPF